MRWLRVVVVALLAGLLQVSLMGALRIGGAVPNLALVALVCVTVWGTASGAIVTAIIAGLIMDTAGSGIFGLATSSLVVISLALVAVRQSGVDGQALPIRFTLVAGASLAWSFIHVASLGVASFAYTATWQLLGLEVALNILLACVCTERMLHGPRTV